MWVGGGERVFGRGIVVGPANELDFHVSLFLFSFFLEL